jgi:FAD:protein FMN transferase
MAFAGCLPLMPLPSPVAELALQHVRRARPLLGTLVEIGVSARAALRQIHAYIDAAFATIERVHALMSYQDPDSELSRINRDAAISVQQIDPHTYRVLRAALEFARLSDGAFDPCVAGPEAIGNWRDIELFGDRHVRYRRGLRLDLSGIAKGYAVDAAMTTLEQFGLDNIMVNAGGDLRVAGAARSVNLRHPLATAHSARTLILQDAALATSAAYYSRRTTQDGEVSALVDPRSGAAYVGNRSVSVRAGNCMSADALTKVVIFASAPIAEAVLFACGAHAYVLDPGIRALNSRSVTPA